MKIAILLVTFFFIIPNCLHSNSYKKYFKYLDPVPDAELVNKNASVIIRPDKSINKESLFQKGAISITGSSRGGYGFQVIASDDGQTIILKPLTPFALGEVVTIKFSSIIKTISNKNMEAFSYKFEIESKEIQLSPNYWIESEISGSELMKQSNGYNNDMISGLPEITVNYYNGPSRGQIFFSNIAFGPAPNTPHLIILNNNGQPYYSKQMPMRCFDFNVQPNNNLTYYIGINGGKYFEMDTNYNVIDSFYCGLGDSTDLHELRLLANGHALLMSYDPQPVDMSKIVEGGNPNATVIGLIIQEIDSKKNVVFRWRSWDHFQITDATHEDLTDSMVDYSHGNAIELDNDGNLMISSRHMDEITKINRTTGDIMWRLGGENNQFTFVNDPDRFSYQHAIRRLSNGNIILYDNGNYHTPPYSRAIEYHLDETNKIATLVWQYRNNPDIYGPAMGFAQRLDNGNTLISWGATGVNRPSITEVKYDGTKVLEITFPPGIFTYRAFKYRWKDNLSGQIIPQSFVLGQNFPNPFNPGTTIRFGIPNINGDVPMAAKVSVFDMLGREVAVLLDEQLLPDTYTLQFDGTNFASGVYFYRLTTPLFNETKRMVLVK